MIPHVIVLEPGLIVYKVYNGYWFFGRPTLDNLRQDLRAVTQKCRPDWDITKPEMKAAWKEGRKELFYPYGTTYAQTLGKPISANLPSKNNGIYRHKTKVHTFRVGGKLLGR